MNTVTVHNATDRVLRMSLADGHQHKILTPGPNRGVPVDFWTRWRAENYGSPLLARQRVRAIPDRPIDLPPPRPEPAKQIHRALRRAFKAA